MKKNLTKDGKDRKLRIVDKLFHERKLAKLIMGLYASVFPLLKSFVILFEMKEPLIHLLHEEQVRLFKEFLVCFIKPDVVMGAKSSSRLTKLDISSQSNQLNAETMFLGVKAQSVNRKSTKKDFVVKGFMKQVVDAYTLCDKVLQDKLPLTNPLLQSLGAIHPETRGHSKTLSYMQKLPTYATTVLNEAETEEYDQEIRKFYIDNSLPEIEDTRIDHWCGKYEVVQKYPNLSKLVQALLSSFHGPQVESSFNVMNDVIDNKSGRLNLETYSAIQTIKYRLSADGKIAIQFFHQKDYMHETVDKNALQKYEQF